MGIEKYIAIASLGLYVMFALQVNTLYDFLDDPFHDIEPVPKLLQFISISIAPASILTAVAYIMSRRYGSRYIGTLLILGGIAVILGMIRAYTRIEYMDSRFITPEIEIAPPVFMIIGIPIIIVGCLLLRRKIVKKRPNLDFSS